MGEQSEFWYVARYENTIKPVTAKYRKDRLSWAFAKDHGIDQQFFDNKADAIAWKRTLLLDAVSRAQKSLVAAERHLKNFDKKFGNEK